MKSETAPQARSKALPALKQPLMIANEKVNWNVNAFYYLKY